MRLRCQRACRTRFLTRPRDLIITSVRTYNNNRKYYCWTEIDASQKLSLAPPNCSEQWYEYLQQFSDSMHLPDGCPIKTLHCIRSSYSRPVAALAVKYPHPVK